MSFIYNRGNASGGGSVGTLTGNAGGIVGPTGGNINIVGAGGVTVTGNPATHTLVITDAGSLRSTTYVAVTPYTVLTTDDIVLVDTAGIGSASTMLLPNSAIDGQEFTIKDWNGDAATYPITVTTVGGATLIDGATSFLLNMANESITVAYSTATSTYSIVSEVGASSGITTIDGDTGSITGTTVTIKSGLSTNNSGETIKFAGVGTVLTLDVTDVNSNTTIGALAGKSGMSGTANSGFGSLALAAITSGLDNTAIGYGSLSSITADSFNTAVGFDAASTILGGNHNTVLGANALVNAIAASYNTSIGYNAGSSYTAGESSNISINSTGVAAESHVLRIGAGTGAGVQQLTSAYISGIKGVNVGSTANIVTNTGLTDQLGTALLTAGAGITITPTANVITIAAAGSTTYVATTPYTVLTTDHTILVDTVAIAAASTVNLPNSPTIDGETWTVKDWSGGAAAHHITVTTPGGTDTIDGATTFVMATNYESITVVWSLSKGTYSIVSEVDAPASITINGDVGSATGNVITITGGTSGAVFTGAGSTLTESFNYLSLPATTATHGQILINGNPVLHSYGAADNMFLGANAGTFVVTGTNNNALGDAALSSLTSGSANIAIGSSALQNTLSDNFNVAVGTNALKLVAGGSTNTAVGDSAGDVLLTGSNNTLLGSSAGTNYTAAESSNILINSIGVAAENNTLRIGAGTGTASRQLSTAYISGIKGVNVGSTATVVTNTGATDQLGTAVLTAGAGITITPTANVITIVASGIMTITPVNHAASPYTVLATDQFLSVDSTGGAVTIRLPNAPTTGRSIIIKDKTGTATGASAMTLTTVGGTVTIDTLTSQTLNTAFQSTNVIFDGVGYEIY